MRNHEITQHLNLVDENGKLSEPGFARKPFWNYNRDQLKVSHFRMKEWDYYLVMSDTFGLAFTLSDLGYLKMASVSFLDFESHQDVTRTVIGAPGLGYSMPVSSSQGFTSWKGNGLDLRFESAPNGKHIYCEFKKFYKNSDLKADLWFGNLPEESMNILTPFEDGKHFYLNQKMNCMPCSGKVVFNWHIYHLDPARDLGVLDWGRGYWPYDVTWYWATASTLVNGEAFGLNLGYGFGNLNAASENAIYYQGRIHKLNDVNFVIPEDPMNPWIIESSDQRLEAVFKPDLDRSAKISAGPILSDQHQYFGLLNGNAILDDGRTLRLEHIRCAIEVVHNKY